MLKDDILVGVAGSVMAAIVGITGINGKALPVDEKENNIMVQASAVETPEKIKNKYENSVSLTDSQLRELLMAVGFEGEALKMAWAVAKKESNGSPLAFNGNKKTGDHSFGLFQINMNGSLMQDRIKKFNLNSASDLFNPVRNAEIAYHMSNGGKNWSSWTQLSGVRMKTFLSDYSQAY